MQNINYLQIAEKYNFPVPRYTSYPTALQFKRTDNTVKYEEFLSGLSASKPISLYLHIPFCEQLCWYCGCHTQITKRQDLISKYIDIMCLELELIKKSAGKKLSINHLHFGGGTPNSISVPLFEKLMRAIYDNFDLTSDAEIATELDPRVLTSEMITSLAEHHFNRISFGVQDFDLDVQTAIHRVQPYDLVARKTEEIRKAGIDKINFDLIYGLPKQTLKKMEDTIQKAESLAPSRLSVFAYAHVPWMKSHQKMIAKNPLPTPEERLKIFAYICDSLRADGYQMIGIDHFAKHDDPLAIAYKNKTLHRNFQGYTTDTADNMIGVGSSSIGKFDNGLVQNDTDIPAYQKAIESGKLPIVKELLLNAEDKRRAKIIKKIMCYFEAEIPSDIMAVSIDILKPYKGDGIIEINGNNIRIIDEKHAPIFARIVASCFDQYLMRSETKHAKAI